MAKLPPLIYFFNSNSEEINIFCRMFGSKSSLHIGEAAL